MHNSPLLADLINSLTCLPGVGKKSAQRMAYHLLERDRDGGERLSVALENAMKNIVHCQRCRNYTETELCHICENHARRDSGILCVVESPQDVVAIENTRAFTGSYFILMGHLSPIDGIGPEEIGLSQLEQLLNEEAISEVILATNPTVEGEATAHYIGELCAHMNVVASRIAHGVPVGGELEYIDGNTLTHAFSGRKKL